MHRPIEHPFRAFLRKSNKQLKSTAVGCALNTSRSQYYTNQAAAALINDFLQGFLDFKSRVLGHTIKLVVQALVHKLMQGLSENI